MGSIEDLFTLFTNGIWGIVQSGSTAVGTGSAVADFGSATAGEVANIVTGSIGLPEIGAEG